MTFVHKDTRPDLWDLHELPQNEKLSNVTWRVCPNDTKSKSKLMDIHKFRQCNNLI